MNGTIAGCAVAPPIQCNNATTSIENATRYATNDATTDLMLLASRVIERNNATRIATYNATKGLHIRATECNPISCAVALPIGCNHATHIQAELSPLIPQLIKSYGGTQEEWIQSAVDSINESQTIDSMKKCWTLLIEEHSVINRKEQEGVLV